MLLLLLFAFIAGIVTILSPCILPMLPIILSSSLGGQSSRSRPIGVIIGFVASFTLFTLFLTSLVNIFNLPADLLRTFSVIVILLFGVALLIPQFQATMERLFSSLASRTPTSNRPGLGGGILIGLSLGLLWTPCVGPILASVIALALTGSVSFQAALITFAYALGTAIPMFFIMIGGQKALAKIPWLTRNTGNIQKIFGVLMIITAIAIFFNYDRKFQTYILTIFPQYGAGLTSLEDNPAIIDQLESLDGNDSPTPNSLNTQKAPPAPELIPGGEWFNSAPLTLAQLQAENKVVLIDFWTYSCINCQRTFPFLRDWWTKYEDDGLVIIGVHAPEFEFEKDPDNVATALEDFDLTYPVVQDNEFKTWRAYSNRYWPAKYLIDHNGNVAYRHFGEGKYDVTEAKIQELLEAANQAPVNESINTNSYQNRSNTPETYLGYSRLEFLDSPEEVAEDTLSTYSHPTFPSQNTYSLAGDWTITKEYAAPEPGAELTLNFDSQNVFIVANPKSPNSPIPITVELNNQTTSLGPDINPDGTLTINADALYQLVAQENPTPNVLKLTFPEGGVELFAFTFG